MEILLDDVLNKFAEQFMACGSRVTCVPAPTDTDRDWIVLIKDGAWDEFCTVLFESSWEQGGSSIPNEVNTLDPDERFNSFTFGEDNIIATISTEFYRKFVAATSVAKRLNLLNKDDRIALFQAVLYGNTHQVNEQTGNETQPK